MAVLLGGIASAHADTRVFSIDTSVYRGDLTQTLQLDKFDTKLGTLNSVNVGFDSHLVIDIGLENLAPYAIMANWAVGTIGTLTGPAGSNVELMNPTGVPQFDNPLSAYDGVTDFAGSSGYSQIYHWDTASGGWGNGQPDPSKFSLFSASGGGKFDVVLSSEDTTYPIRTPELYFVGGTDVWHKVTVTYDYTPAPVPEPTTYAMMIAGLGLLAFKRRRQAK